MSGKNKVSIKEIAKLAGVSIATVSNVLHENGKYTEETRQKVLKVVEENNFVVSNVARSLQSSSSHMIGIVIPNIRNDFFCTVATDIEQFFSAHEYSTLICNTGNDAEKERKYFQTLKSMQVDGIICISCQKQFDMSLVRKGTPVVFVDRAFSGHEDFTYVLSDSYSGMYQAVNLMLEKGCRHPYCIMRDNSNVDSTSQDNAGRYNGFTDALRNNGITEKTEDLTILIPSHGDSAQLTEQAIVDFLKKGKPVDCIAAFSDNEALGVIRGLKKSGLRVPEDVMVFGFDNVSESAICSPTLSTVGRFNEKIARIAAEKLYERIQDPSKDIPEKIILPVEVIERESTAK